MKIQLLKSFIPVIVFLGLAGRANAQDLPDFTALVEKNAPAIVKVGTTRTSEPLHPESRARYEELLRYFYGDQAPPGDLPLPEPDTEERGATGSGFIIDSSGYIVTNHHVVDGADTITVTLYDQRELKAEVIGSDESSDLALLKVNGQNLPVVELGDSSRLKVGEWVLAMGSPFGLQFSVAAGIISYMGRALPTEGTNYVSYIQTDVAINPGHSGGPLFNLAGEVIGINSQIFTNSGGSIGLSFAIPVDVAKNVVSQLRTSGSVSRGYIGIAYKDVEILFDLAGGPLEGRTFKAFFPGGSSAPVLPLTDETLDLAYDFDTLAKAGTMLGSGAIIVFDDSTSIVDVAYKTAHFYRHESCGKCSPCREGTNWTEKMLVRIKNGDATPMDLDIMAAVCEQIMGNCLCVLGDAMAMPISSMIKHFRHEFEAYIEAARERAGSAPRSRRSTAARTPARSRCWSPSNATPRRSRPSPSRSTGARSRRPRG